MQHPSTVTNISNCTFADESGDYLSGMDLPPSSSESGDDETEAEESETADSHTEEAQHLDTRLCAVSLQDRPNSFDVG